MQTEPKTEKELKNLIPKDQYSFEVLSAEDKYSQAGNEMISLTIGIYYNGKLGPRIFDFLMPSVAYKLRHFCDAVGLLAEYESGNLTADMCTDRSGKCVVDIKKDDTWGDKNIIKDYICRPAKPLTGADPSSTKSPETKEAEKKINEVFNKNEVPEGDVPF